MQCPFCQGQMRAGRTEISRTTMGMVTDLISGDLTSMPHYLYFHPEGDGDSICLDHSRQAFHCSRCEAFVIAGTETKPEELRKHKPERSKERGEERSAEVNPTNCPACGAAIDFQNARCPACDIALR